MKSTERENRHQNLEDNESVSSAASVAEREVQYLRYEE